MNEKGGIALDIDDTLADTFRHFIGELQKKFGNPENLTVDEIVEKYRIMPAITYWQTPEIKAWLDEQGASNEAQENIPPTPDAVEAVKKINEMLPVRMYITSRP
ncbi:HAD family hydrolase [Candidatus Parcubacteria bacterium]|nr:HAD family hydrolase [Candidatus Parcubacteria bacterium]